MYYRNRRFRRLPWAPRDPNTSLPPPAVGIFAGIQYWFSIGGNFSGNYFLLPGAQIPVYWHIRGLPGYNTALVLLGLLPAIILCSLGPIYQFTGRLGFCRDTILVWYRWEWLRRFLWALRTPIPIHHLLVIFGRDTILFSISGRKM
jgi:hypothetical protein